LSKEKTDYFRLAEATLLQKIILTISIVAGIILFYAVLIPLIKYFVVTTLNGAVHSGSNELVSYTLDNTKIQRRTDPLFVWAVDLYLKTPTAARFWFQPIFSMSMIAILFGVVIGVYITTFLPLPFGYFKQKIEREIINTLDKIYYKKFFAHIDAFTQQELMNEIGSADLRGLHRFSSEYDVPVDDLTILQNAILWKKSNILYQSVHFLKGIKIYMRNHFTDKYSNTILGFVYFGAAFLLEIIGLRGLKFIPVSEPSLIFFSLGLEFSILITYASTLCFSKPENVEEQPKPQFDAKSSVSDPNLERLLRIFIKWRNQ
jgi:hypothetical protein